MAYQEKGYRPKNPDSPRSLRDPEEVAEEARLLDTLINRDPVRRRALAEAAEIVRLTGSGSRHSSELIIVANGDLPNRIAAARAAGDVRSVLETTPLVGENGRRPRRTESSRNGRTVRRRQAPRP